MPKDLLSDSSSDSGSDGGAGLTSESFKVNESFARKFEHNKKREEKQRLEEKLGKDSRKRKRDDASSQADSGSDESTSESEDEGELDTEAVDAEMMATINAIRSKDPKIYDPNAKFYTAFAEDENEQPKIKKDKPMHLQDYHRRNLLNGSAEDEDGEDGQPLTYNQEQEQLKNTIVKEMHAAVDDSGIESQDSDAEFLVAKEKVIKPKKSKHDQILDVESADKDPDTFLSNFMASRAWAYPDERNLVPFESDDEEDDRRAEEYEEAYNMRFEDPAKANEKLRSHARDMAAKYSVRRDETNPRQKKRAAEKAKKEDAKRELKEEKARLRKLRIEEAEEKVRRIKRAAGLHSKDLQPEDWARFVDEDWDDETWEKEMQTRFGEEYYADNDVESDDEGSGKHKPKKPKFDDDIDIKDIVPDYTDEDEQPNFSLSDNDDGADKAPQPKKQSHTKEKAEKKRSAKRDRRIIEQLVDDQLQLELDHSLLPPSKSKSSNSERSGFRYRETSPQSFGLTSRDILLADDTQLNQYAGLKKLAAFRDTEKKQKDKKHLGKKARLRKWRAEVFGDEEGLEGSELVPASKTAAKMELGMNGERDEEDEGEVNIVEGARQKKKRRRKNKQKTGEAEI